MVNSNILKDQLISSDFSQYLLKNDPYSPPDFVLTNVSCVYLYPNINDTPFQDLCDKMLALMKQFAGHKAFSSLLKSLPNLYAGQMALSSKSFPDTYFLKGQDFQSLRQMKHFLSSEHLVNDIYEVKFSSNRPIKNHCHNFFYITQKGREIFLKCLISLCTFLNATLVTCNCDSIWLASAVQAKPAYTSQPAILTLDQWLKAGLNPMEIEEYIRVKFLYFMKTSVCSSHVASYRECLLRGDHFRPLPFFFISCCYI